MHPRAATAVRLSSPVPAGPARHPAGPLPETRRRAWPLPAAFAVLTVLALTYPVTPFDGAAQRLYFNALGFAAVALGVVGLRRHRPANARNWVLVLSGCGSWAAADAIWTVESQTIPDVYPAPSDVLYLGAYLLLGAGVLGFVSSRERRDRAALLDSAIVTTGAAVLAVVFLVVPLTDDSTLSTWTKIVMAAYPLGDLFLLGVVARLLAGAVARTTAFRLLGFALLLTLSTDVAWNAEVAGTGDPIPSSWLDAGWLLGYLLVSAAACVPSMRTLSEPGRERVDTASLSGRRRLALAAGLSLPAVALLLDGAGGADVSWLVIGVGTLLLSSLVLVRMLGLLGTVQDQAARLAALARADGLTGAPNRRTWDVELAAACAEADRSGAELAVALIDLDRFKTFNDTHGHQAGDRLLREAVRIWSAELPEGALLARYGGEEFAALFPGRPAAEAVGPLQRMRTGTPDGQTFSAGLADRTPGTPPDAVVEAADQALYAAKRAGRDRVVVAGAGNPAPLPLPRMTMVSQPVVDVVTGVVTGHEALARFPEQDGLGIEEIFRRAHADGTGDLLELAALVAALELPGRPPEHDLYVNVTARALISPRFRDGLPERLAGVVLELGEHPDDVPLAEVLKAVAGLRDRGARIALDDVGAGSEEFARLAALRPDVVKVDRSIVDGCAQDRGRTAVLSALVTYAAEAGSVLCGEGVERAEDLAHLRLLGVPLAQGYLLARPAPGWTTTVAVAVPAQRRS